MILAIAWLAVSAASIYWSCEFFVNGIEWVGKRFRLSQGAIGGVLAAFGTALPESAITLVAVVFFPSESSKEIGVGAALGGPLVLSTIAYGIVGLTFILRHGRDGNLLRQRVDQHALSRDQRWFLWIFFFKAALGLVAFSIKPWLGILFVAAYLFYSWRTLKQPVGIVSQLALAPLKLRPHDASPSLGWIFIQTGLAMAVIFIASQIFVHQLELIGPWLGLPPQLVALLLSPIATELPETLNAVIWVRQGKERLALSNISGSMMIQATIPSALGIIFTPWRFDPPLMLAAVVTMVSIAALYVLLRRNRLTAAHLAGLGLVYLLFVLGLIMIRAVFFVKYL